MLLSELYVYQLGATSSCSHVLYGVSTYVFVFLVYAVDGNTRCSYMFTRHGTIFGFSFSRVVANLAAAM